MLYSIVEELYVLEHILESQRLQLQCLISINRTVLEKFLATAELNQNLILHEPGDFLCYMYSKA
jgi:hypothetical protein